MKNGLFNDLNNVSNRTVLVRFSPLVYFPSLSTLSCLSRFVKNLPLQAFQAPPLKRGAGGLSRLPPFEGGLGGILFHQPVLTTPGRKPCAGKYKMGNSLSFVFREFTLY